jgi:hypothetical protein
VKRDLVMTVDICEGLVFSRWVFCLRWCFGCAKSGSDPFLSERPVGK